MPEHLRAFVVIAVLSVMSFLVLHRPVVAMGMAEEDFRRRRNLWLAVTALAFLSSSFWIFVLVSGSLLLFARRERNPFALYLFLLFAVPPFAAALPGLGIVNKLFELSFPRLLALLVLLPYALRRRDPGTPGFGKAGADWLVLAYLVLQLVLQYRADSFTNTLRSGFNSYLDIFLPYYVASRSLRNGRDVRDVLLSLVVSVLVLVPIALFEFFKHWLLYAPLPDALGMNWEIGGYLGRGETLRAVATTGHSIVLGYVMSIALLLHFGLRQGNPLPRAWLLGAAALGVGLLAAVSRGPWVGCAAGLLALAVASRRPGRRLVRLVLPSVVIVAGLLLSPWGDRIIDYLPFIGTIDANNVTYRQTLFEVSLKVIAMDPWFGSPYFMYTEPMQSLRVGNLIDVVNSYLLVALRYGYVGLVLFCAVFATALRQVIVALARQPDESTERFAEGQAILGMLVAVLVTIATVSDISFIPILLWSAAGLAVGYGQLVATETVDRRGAAPILRDGFHLSSSLPEPAVRSRPGLKQRAFSAGRWSVFGMASGQAIRLVTTLVMTRLLSPSMFGVMAIVVMVYVIAGLLTDLGIRQNIIQRRRDDDPRFLDTAWTAQIIRGFLIWAIAVLVSVAFYVAGRTGAVSGDTVYASPILPWVLAVSSLAVAIYGFQSTKVATAERDLDQRPLDPDRARQPALRLRRHGRDRLRHRLDLVAGRRPADGEHGGRRPQPHEAARPFQPFGLGPEVAEGAHRVRQVDLRVVVRRRVRALCRPDRPRRPGLGERSRPVRDRRRPRRRGAGRVLQALLDGGDADPERNGARRP